MELLLRGLKELSDLIRSKNSEFVALLKQATQTAPRWQKLSEYQMHSLDS